MTPAARTHYQTTTTVTASPEQLVLMLYDRMLAQLDLATNALADEPADMAIAHHALVRTQQILDELRVSLDTERGGTIAANLAGLYAYCAEQVVEANIRKDPTTLAVAVRIIEGLRDAWHIACVSSPTLAAASS